jgi:nitroreductase
MEVIIMNNTLKILNERVSLRRYKDQDIKEKHLNQILDSAMRAPTAGNMMPYSIIVVKDKKKKEILSETCDNQPFIAKAPVLLVFVADFKKTYDYFDVCDLKEYCKKENIKYKSPNLASLFLAFNDALIAAQNAVIAAESLNIGSCYIGDIVENYEIKKELFELPQYVLPVAMLTLGYYPDDYKKRKSDRFDKKYVVFNETYKKLDEKELKDMYKTKEEKIKNIDKYNTNNYGQYIYKRKFAAEFFEEMERSLQLMIINWLEDK